MTKAQRQHRIAQLIEDRPIASQAELVALLAADGMAATQATVSRDLVELGAVKVRGHGGARTFALAPAATSATTEQLHRVLAEWVVEVAASGPLVVVRTPPGCAHVVASALDRGGLRGVLGTVAGDDTIFVAVDERRGGRAVAGEVRALAGLGKLAAPSRPRARSATTRATKRGR